MHVLHVAEHDAVACIAPTWALRRVSLASRALSAAVAARMETMVWSMTATSTHADDERDQEATTVCRVHAYVSDEQALASRV